jgi:hypothetical protein
MGIRVKASIDENLLSLLAEMDKYYYLDKLLIPKLKQYRLELRNALDAIANRESGMEYLEISNLRFACNTLVLPHTIYEISQVKEIPYYLYQESYDEEEKDAFVQIHNELIKEISSGIERCENFLIKGHRREKRILSLMSKNKK